MCNPLIRTLTMKHHKHHAKHHGHHTQHLVAPPERKGSNKLDSGMIDNRMVNDNHQQGISRVLQRRSEYNPKDCEGHHGKMVSTGKAHWSRKGDSLTPRKA